MAKYISPDGLIQNSPLPVARWSWARPGSAVAVPYLEGFTSTAGMKTAHERMPLSHKRRLSFHLRVPNVRGPLTAVADWRRYLPLRSMNQ